MKRARALVLTSSHSCWVISPWSTISLGVMGTSPSSALVVGVTMFFSSLSFFTSPSGRSFPQ